jgi:signal recognition particle GTPase
MGEGQKAKAEGEEFGGQCSHTNITVTKYDKDKAGRAASSASWIIHAKPLPLSCE